MPKSAQLEFRSISAKSVSVAGDFNDWCGSTKGKFDPGSGKMQYTRDGVWIFPLTAISHGNHQFKFVVDGEWESGPNRTFYLDDKGALVDPTGGIIAVTLEETRTVRIRFSALAKLPKLLEEVEFSIHPKGTILSKTRHEGLQGEGEMIDLHCRDLNVLEPLTIEVKGLNDSPIKRGILPDGIFRKHFISSKPLGATVEGNPATTVFRLFAPRAKKTILQIFGDPTATQLLREVPGTRDQDGVWEMKLEGLWWGKFYGFRVDGPKGEGEGFDFQKLWPDPYSRASVFHHGPSILVEPGATGEGFEGWTDSGFKTPKKKDLIIWECSVRDLTSHPSSKVDALNRGKYRGLASTVGKGTGIDHAKMLGATAIELLPVFEFDDEPPGAYHWGYMPSLYFAPEASYATHAHGAQVLEFKSLVNTIHGQGLAVILDVVYNHTGAPQVLMGLDRKYFYRQDGNLVLHNFSGCGNDFKSENPMARRLIIDSLEHWVREYHIDGFRFDLAELIDLETLLEIEKRLKAINPDIILIGEPWSFRGSIKGKLKETAWTNWNDDFRNRVKECAQGRGGGESLLQVLTGSLDLWTAHPLESVNYVESHDDFTLTDHFSPKKNHDGSNPGPAEIRRNLFCAAATLLSPGIPMLAQGQEFLRSKFGHGNSYNAGDQINGVDYSLREKNSKVFAFYRDLIALRKSDLFRSIREAGPAECRKAVRIVSADGLGAGLLWEDPRERGRKLLLLLNCSSSREVMMNIPLSPGKWLRIVGNGAVISPTSLFRKELLVTSADEGGVSMDVSPMNVELWIPRPT